MTTPWNTFAGQTAVHEPPAQAEAWQTAPQQPTQPALHQPYHQPAFQQPAFEQFPPAGQPFAQGGMPPQGPGFNGFNGFNGGQPPKTNRTPLIISLVVAAVLLIGGGVGAFFLLNKKSDPANNPAHDHQPDHRRAQHRQRGPRHRAGGRPDLGRLPQRCRL